MALEKRNISLSFSQGLDTKTDPFQVVAGKFLALENVTFTTGLSFNKRNGYSKLSALDAGAGLGTFKSELVSFDGSDLYSYAPSSATNVNKGNMVGCELEVNSIYRNANAQTQQDSAYNANADLYLYVWVDSVNGAQYMVVSGSTGQQVVTAQTLVTNAVKPRAWAMGNYLIVTYVNSATHHLVYIAIPTLNPSVPGSVTDLATTVNTANPNYDGVVVNDNLFISWNGSDGGGAIRTTRLDSNLNQHNTVAMASQVASSCIGVFADTSYSIPNIWVAYCNGTNVKYFILTSNTLSTYLAATSAIGSLSGIQQINGWATSGAGKIYYQTSNTYSYSSVRSDFVTQIAVTDTGTIGANSVLVRGVGIVSKVFEFNDIHYFIIAYGSPNSQGLAMTYFAIDESGHITAKIAYTNAGGYATQADLANVNSISSSVFEFAYLIKDQLTTQTGTVYTQTGVNSVSLNFDSDDLYQSAELGNSLNINGGFLWMYDGYGPVEQNFHIFPEDMAASGTSGGSMGSGTYQYIAIYQWTDNQGNIHRSGYGTPLSFTSSASGRTTIQVPTLRLTAKKNTISPVSITLFRDAPSVQTGIFYRVSSVTSPTLNNTAVDSVVFTDTAADASIIGNELLYTTGGVVQDSGAPSAVGMTIFKNRILLINAEDRNQLWYSKQTLENTPVEMSDEFTFFVDPRFGGMKCVSVMDDKAILFKPGAIFYMVGNGPDSTGAQNDFTEATFITSTVGTSNPKSIALTPNGLMFQSETKGIWLLDRSLGISYVGAPVEAYNQYRVTSAQLIPNSTQVRFTLSNGIALVYDYYYDQWGTYSNHDATASVIFDALFTYIQPTGNIYQEAPGVYTDDGQPILMGGTMSWLSLAGLQGYQRAYRLMLLGKYLSPHVLRVSVGYDFNSALVQTDVVEGTELDAGTYGSDPFYGSEGFFGGIGNPTYQWRLNLNRQKCQTIRVSFQEGIDTSSADYGAGLSISAIGLVAGMKSTYPRLPATRYVTST